MHTTRTVRLSALTRRFVPFIVCALVALAFAGGIAPAYGQDVVTKRQFDLPAGEATKTLRMFSQQSGRPLVADTDLVRDVQTNAVKGEYSVEEAMSLLLDGTGLIASQDAKSGAYTVRKGETAPNAQRAAQTSDRPSQSSPTEADRKSDDSVVHLSRFEVAARTDKGYGATQSISGSRFAIPIEDLAATLVTITPKLMTDINPNEPSDAAKYVAGVNTATAKYGGQYTVRGYNIIGINHRDGLPETSIVASTGGGTTDFAGIERMEVIEGPYGVLYGAQTVGGLINFVSKRPSPIYSASATAQYGSFDFFRVDLNATGPVTQDKNLLFRVDGAIQDAKLQMGLPYKKTTIVPYLEYRFGPRTKVWGRFNYLHAEVASDTASWYMDYNNTFSSFMGTRQYLGEKDEVREMTYRDAELGISTSVEAGSATWDFRLVGRFNNFSWDQTTYNVSNYNLLDSTGAIIGHVGTGATNPATDVFSNPAIKSIVALRNRQYNPEINHDGLVTFDAVGNFDVGPVKNTMLTNLQVTVNNFTRHIWRWDYPNAQVFPTVQHVSGDPLAAATNQTLITNFQSNNHQFAFGFQDNASMLNDRLIFVFGARYDYSQQTDNNLLLATGGLETSIHQWTYKAGAIFKPIEHVSVFYDYSETFNPASNRDPNTNKLFPNLLGVMNEVGVKGELFDSRLIATASYFDILLQNAVTFVNDPNGGPGSLVNQGDATTKGWDLNLTAIPTKGLNIIAGIGNLSSKTQAGIRRRGVPQGTSYKIFATYEFTEGSLNGFKFGGGYEFENARAGNTTDTLKLPSYDLIELMAAYNHGPWRIQLNVYNAADKIFAFTSVNANKIWPVEPRTYRLSVGYGF